MGLVARLNQALRHAWANTFYVFKGWRRGGVDLNLNIRAARPGGVWLPQSKR
jgi:hypothetical protein